VNGGLWLLARLLLRGRLRLIGRRLKTVRGALAIGGSALFVLAFATLQLWRATNATYRTPPPSVDTLRAMVPAIVLVFVLMSAVSERGLYFTPAETGFLFPAPVTRRELLAYNLVTRMGVQLLSGLWLSIFSISYAPLPGAGFAAVMLAFIFIYAAAQALTLGASAVESYLSAPVRRLLRAGLIVGLIALVGSSVISLVPGSAGTRFRAILESPLVQALSFPARPLGELYASETAGAALLWGLASVALIVATLGLALGFDFAYIERSLVIGRRTQRRLSRLRSTSADAEGDAPPSPARWRPRAPRIPLPGHAGALAWRQVTELLRTPRALMMPLLLAGVWLVAMFGSMRAADDDAGTMRISVMAMALLMPIIFGNPVAFDFRRDLDRLAFLRSLPLSPFAVAAGQVFPAALFFALFEILVLSGAQALTHALPASWMVAAAALMIPVSWALAALENLLFLLMPYRVSADGRAGPQFMGKALLVMILKVLTLVALALVGASAWIGVGWVMDAPALAIGLAAVLMMLPAAALTAHVGRRFQHYDLSREVPGG
jgi:hypothetical protein